MNVVLMRHAQSEWNKTHRFSGWTDVDLSAQGALQAKEAGQILLRNGLVPDIAFTSVLKRAIRTLSIVLDEAQCSWVPVYKTWHLNERHYGALEGLSKVQMVSAYGPDQVQQWRRGYDSRPPELNQDDPRYAAYDRRYAGLASADMPRSESLRDAE